MKQRIFIAPALYVAGILLPVYWLLLFSLKTNAEITVGFSFWPQSLNFSNFQFIFSNPDWYFGYVNALIYAGMNVIISITVALPSAYAFSRYNFFGQRGLFFGLLMFRMLAPAILLAPFVQIFSDLGLIDTHIAVAIAHCFFNVPLAIWILEGFISAIPRQIDQSAMIDGYSRLGLFVKFIFPQLRTGISVAAFFCFMFSWIEFMLANALTTINAKPIAGIITRAASVLSGDLSLLAAASIVGLAPGVLIIFLMRKNLAAGFSMGRLID